MRKITKMAVACLFLFGGAGTVFAQNQVISGTLTVTKSVSLNTASGNTTIDGNTTLGNSSFNTITFNAAANSLLNMGSNDIQYAGNVDGSTLNLGINSTGTLPYSGTATTGTIYLYNSSASGRAKIQAASQGSSTFTYTIPNSGTSASFVMTQGAQTINGQKTFSNTSNITAPLVASNTIASGTALAVTSGNVNIAGLTASAPVFTDASNNLTSTGTIPVANGGTGNTSLTAYEVVVANSTGSAMTQVSGVGSASQVLTSNGTGAAPTWQPSGGTITNNTASQNVPATEDLNASNAAAYIRLTNSTGGELNVTGIQSSGFTNGRVITLVNVSSAPADVIQLTNLDVSSASADQFDLPGGQPMLLGQKGAATFIYDATLAKWELFSTN